MKIFFRYLFMRLLVPFFICLFGCGVIWIMVDLYGNIDDFLEHKVSFHVILYFYSLRIPSMLVQALPAAILFSALWTLLGLNRRSELVAFQSGGMAPIWLFSPFFLFTAIWVLVLAYDLNGPAASSEVSRERVLQQVKGQGGSQNVFQALPYVDKINHRVWMFQKLDIGSNTAADVTITQLDAYGHEMIIYGAHSARWNGEFWKLSKVKKIVYDVNGNVQSEKVYEELDLPDVTTPPGQLSLIISQPEQLTVPQLSQYIATSTSSQYNLAKYRTQWWYRILHPFSLFVMLLFALLNGMHTDRRGAAAGVAWCIGIFFLYIVSLAVFMPFGNFNRLPPYVAVIAPQIIFGAIGLHLLAVKNGWWWQLREVAKRWTASPPADQA